MKIAMTHVDLPNESKGGVASQVHYFANMLTERGHDVTMFTFSPAYDQCRYHVHQYPRVSLLWRFKSFLFAARLAATDFSGFDVLHTNGDNYLIRSKYPHIRTFYGSAIDEAKTAITLRRRVYQRIIARLEDVGARVARVTVGISEATRSRIPSIKMIIPCGVDVTRFRPGPKVEKPVILFVGTTGGRKRGSLLAEIFTKEIRPCFPDAELWTVADIPMEGEGIINHGRVSLDELTSLYQRAWVFCLPSTYEGFGVPYIEALASGTAVVATPNPGAREVLEDGKYGIVVDDKQIGKAINSLLSDASRREAFATMGLLHAQKFSWETVVEQYERTYQDLNFQLQPLELAAASSRHAPHPDHNEDLIS